MSQDEATRKSEKPVVDIDTARRIAEELFGVVPVGKVKELDSYVRHLTHRGLPRA